ncbi:MAG: MlaD family protein [Planctomycetota bacterium]|jgi:ABC-type transporter Mla subunit MlaD
MPSPNERSRNNVRAGVFVTLSLLLGLAVMFIITDAWTKLTRPMHSYTVVFDVASGVNKLSKGSEVRVGGIVEGSVLRVWPQIDDRGAVTRIDVEFELLRDIQLFEGAQIFVSSAVVGTDSWLEIIDIGDAARPLMDNRLVGLPGAGPLNSLFGPQIGEDFSVFTRFLRGMPDKYDQSVQPILDNLVQTTDDVKDVVHDVKEDEWPRWSGRIDEVMAWAVEATGEVDATLEEGRNLFADARGVIGENRENVRVTMDNVAATSGDMRETGENVRAISHEARNHTMAQVSAFLDRTSEGLDDAIALLGRFRTDSEGWSSDADEVMGNAVIASQQMKLISMEVRRSPWKLLYQPTDTEIQHELLYEAVRSFALAVADLSAASKSVERILDRHSDLLAEDPGLEARVRQNLVDSVANYEQAQQRLFNILLETRP